MNSLWLKVRVWTKIAILALAIVYIFAFLLENSGQAVRVWIFPYKEYSGVSVLVLIFLAFAIGVIGTLLVAMAVKTMRQLRDMRERSRSGRLEREIADMKSKAARLQTRSDEEKKEESKEPEP